PRLLGAGHDGPARASARRQWRPGSGAPGLDRGGVPPVPRANPRGWGSPRAPGRIPRGKGRDPADPPRARGLPGLREVLMERSPRWILAAANLLLAFPLSGA